MSTPGASAKYNAKPKMAKSSRERRFTLLLVSSHGDNRSVSFGIRTPRIILTVICVAIAAFLLFARNYRVNTAELQELRYMHDVAESQKEQIRVLEEQYSALNERLRQAELLEAQVREMLEKEGVLPQSFSPAAGIASQSRNLSPVSRDSSSVSRSASAAEMGRALYLLKETADKFLDETSSIEEKAGKLHKESVEIVSELRGTPNIWPVLGNVTSEYGWRRHPVTYTREHHDGIDIGAQSRTPITATADGVVTFSGYKYGYGYTVILSHGYGYETLYAHCSKLKASLGQKVTRGDVIGYVGQSGISTGPHLHYEVRVWGKSTNPREYLPEDTLEVGYSVR